LHDTGTDKGEDDNKGKDAVKLVGGFKKGEYNELDTGVKRGVNPLLVSSRVMLAMMPPTIAYKIPTRPVTFRRFAV
jgi:hypothetical protein